MTVGVFGRLGVTFRVSLRDPEGHSHGCDAELMACLMQGHNSSLPRALKMAALEDIKASAHKIPSKAGNRAHEGMPR